MPQFAIVLSASALLVLAAAPAAAQISTSLPPQTIGRLPSDRDIPTELQQVQALQAAGRRTDALKLADELLAKNPRNAQMRFVRGVLLLELNKPAEAREVFQRLTEDFPELPEPYNNLAVLYASEGRLDSARAALEKALTAAPGYSTALENLGDVYLQMAADAYQRANKADPGNRQAGAKLALARELITKSRSVR
jgi:tetratricopeptide (TPR) repeat protein